MRKIFSLFVVALFAMGAMADMYLPGTWNGTFSAGNDSRYKFEDSRLTLTLEANTTYEFKFYDDSKSDAMKWFGLGNSTMTSGNSTGWWFYYKDKNNCKITTTYAGEYVFTIDRWVDDTEHENDWCPVLSAVYPEVTKNAPVASNHLFATYQEHGNTYVETNGEKPLQWGVDNYVVTCGQQILYRTKTAGSLKFDGNTWATQVRVNGAEIQATQIISNQEHCTPNNATLSTASDDVSMYFFVFCNGFQHRKTAVFTYNRKSINNPTSDNVAPVLNVANTTIDASGENIVVTFGDVTADDEYFYYVADEEHKIAAISLSNTITIAKPTVQDGTTYNFVCCAVDYNGNMSNAKEYQLVMPFDAETNLALSGVATAGHSENDNYAPQKANDGNSDTRWNSWGYTEGNNWWQVELKNVYYITSIKADYRDFSGTNTTFRYEGSVDGTNWRTLVSGSNPSNGEAVYEFAAKEAKFIRFSANRYATVNEFEVYGMGLVTEDTEAPVVNSVVVKDGSLTETSVTLQLDATDNVAVSTCRIYDATTGYTKNVDYASEITLSDLAPATEYNFKVTVYDVAENASLVYNVDSFTTLANTHIPSIAAPVPARDSRQVRAIYTDAYALAINSNYLLRTDWDNCSILDEERNINNDKCRVYKMRSELFIWGSNGGRDGQTINGLEGMTDGTNVGLDASVMEYMHVDIWCDAERPFYVTINDKSLGAKTPTNTTAGQWTGFDIAVSGVQDINNVRFMKFRGFQNGDVVAVDNVYFYTTQDLDAAPVLTTITAAPASNYLQVGVSSTISLAIKDQLNRNMEAEVTYTTSPENAGTFNGNTFTPTQAGFIIVSARATAGEVSVDAAPFTIYAYEGENVARSKNVTAYEGTRGTPGDVVDGNKGDNTWDFSNTNDKPWKIAEEQYDATHPSWIQIDLGAAHDISLFGIYFSGACSQGYKVQYSANGIDFTDAYIYARDCGINHGHTDILYPGVVKAGVTDNHATATGVRYVRVLNTKMSGYGARVYEIEVYGTLSQGAVMEVNAEVWPKNAVLQTAASQVRVLSLNNSLIDYNDQYAIFNSIATAMGKDATWTKHTNLGKTLDYHYDEDQLNPTAREEIASTSYTHIILQEQSNRPRTEFTAFRASVKRWVEYIRQHGANPNAIIILPVNWAYSTETTEVYAQHNETLIANYTKVAQEFGLVLCPMAKAYQLAVNDNPAWKAENSMLYTDNRHPSLAASYMAACAEYSVIFGEDATTITTAPNGLTLEVATAMRSYAKQAIDATTQVIDHRQGKINYKVYQVDNLSNPLQELENITYSVSAGAAMTGNILTATTAGEYTITAQYNEQVFTTTAKVAAPVTVVPDPEPEPEPVADAILLSFANDTYTQNFDAEAGSAVTLVTETNLANAGDGKRSWSLEVALPEFWKTRTSSENANAIGAYETAATSTTYVGGTKMPSNAKNGTWNFGKLGDTDRAIGGVTTSANGGARCINIMTVIKNASDADIQSLTISYDIEKYRKGTNSAGYTYAMHMSKTGKANSWEACGANFVSTFTADAAFSETDDEHLPVEIRQISEQVLNVTLAPGEALYLDWHCAVTSGDTHNNAMAFGLDNVVIKANYATYDRTTTEGNYGTICMDKAVGTHDYAGAIFYNIAGVTKDNGAITGIVLEEETEALVAGKPYIFRATDVQLRCAYHGDAVNTEAEATGLVGNLGTAYAVPQYSESQKTYVLKNNLLYYVNSNVNVGQNKAYIDLTNVAEYTEPAEAQGRVFISTPSGVATGIEDAALQNESVKMLVGGQLLIKKGAHTYNTMGQIVK